jgi:hypothetical protein
MVKPQRQAAGRATAVQEGMERRLDDSVPTAYHHRSPHETGTKIRSALETAGVEFIDENGGGPGVRLRKR